MMAKARETTAKSDLLIEIGTEDLPARYVKPLADALATGMVDGLREQGVVYQQLVHSYATPRRIAVIIAGVASKQNDRAVERKGPKLGVALKDGAPTPAGLGFAKSCGVEFSQLAQEDGQLVFRSLEKGLPTIDLIPNIFERTLKSMDQLVPKRMRWGSGDETFVRPVQWIVCMLGAKVIPIRRFGLKGSNKTYGHRFHSPKTIELKSSADYEKKLRSAKVWADFDSRREEIRKQIEVTARQLKGRARITESLLEEVTALVEWPVAIAGHFDKRFLSLPPEVIIATIEHNQRYFPVFGAGQKLLPVFITLSNIVSKDPKQVVLGNERVVRPRLTDALFFWEQDLKKPLGDYVDALDRVTFVENLGSLLQKACNIEVLSDQIARALGVDPAPARRAALLCKADLVTRMVYEFPELQGTMGGYYARSSKETDEVAIAISEHYLPNQSGGAIPASSVGRIVALADKVDTLAGIFGLGQKPSASKDPYALRRAALGVMRILIEGELDLDLRDLLAVATSRPGVKNPASLLDELLQFHLERLRNFNLENGVPVEIFESVLATGITRPLDFARRLVAVQEFVRLPEAAQLAAAHKRVRNILRGAEGQAAPRCNPVMLRDDAEKALHAKMVRLQTEVGALSARNDYSGAMKKLASAQIAVDRFFDSTMVMADDLELRANRLALLKELDLLCREVADISCLPG